MTRETVLLAAALGSLGCSLVEAVQAAEAERIAMMRACDAGDAPTCVKVGDEEMKDHESGNNPVQERALGYALSHYERACNLGKAEGCVRLSEYYEQSHERALPLALRGCDLGAATGCLLAISHMKLLHGPKADEARIAELASRACDLDLDACPDAARLALEAALPVGEAIAIRPCDEGRLPACERAARHYAVPTVPIDVKARVLGRACDAGAIELCVRLGYDLLDTRPSAARDLFGRACAHGSEQACAYLGQMTAGVRVQ
jgi:TPR repeat protein